MPNHCYATPVFRPEYQKIDFRVKWQPTEPYIPGTNYSNPEFTTTASTVLTQTDLDYEICEYTKARNDKVPYASGFEDLNDDYEGSEDQIHYMFGVALTGAPFLNAITDKYVDPIRPDRFRAVYRPSSEEAIVDSCLGTVVEEYRMYGHFTISNCVFNGIDYARSKKDTNGFVANSITNLWSSYAPYRTAVGIAKDGRLIWSPYYEDDDTGDFVSYDPCDIDICNGYKQNFRNESGGDEDYYSYVTTRHHPYHLGCYGPGSKPELF